MQVHELMTQDVECTRPEATIEQAAERMKTLGIGALPVSDNGRLVGVLTDRDIVVRSVSAGHDPRTERVRDVMTPDMVYCFQDEDITAAADLMRDNQIRRLPVLDHNQRLVGIVSLGDLAVEAGVEYLAGQTLEGISEPSAPVR